MSGLPKKQEAVEAMIVSLTMVIGVTFSMSQTLVYWWQTPPGKIFLFAHNYLADYYYYLHIMRQGWDGLWMATSRLTPEVYPGQFVVVFFLFLGHLARIVNLSLPLTYTLARAIGAGVLFYLTYLLIRRVYDAKEKRLLALTIVIFGTFWWGVANGGPQMPWLVRAWTELDPLFRGSYIPHHLWSKIFFLISLLMLTSGARVSLWRTAVIVMIVAAMGFASPVIIIVFVPLVMIWTTGELLINNKLNLLQKRTLLIMSVIAVGTAAIVALYHRHIQYSVFPWTGSYIAWENSLRYPIDLVSLLASLGPALIFFLIALPRLIKESPLTRLLVVWAGVEFLLLFVVGQLVPLSNSRYLSGAYFIPIGIGAVRGIWEIGIYINKLIPKTFYKICLAIITLLFAYFAIGLWTAWQLHLSYVRQNSNNIQVYLPSEIFKAFQYLDENSTGEEVVLARYPLSTMIPAFTSDRVISGHALMSVDNELRHREIDRFYSYEPTSTEAKAWLVRYRVKFIIEDQATDETDRYYQLFTARAVYTSGKVKIYKI